MGKPFTRPGSELYSASSPQIPAGAKRISTAFYYISQNPNITIEIIRANLDHPWNWAKLTTHPNITWEIIQSNLDLPWRLKDFSRNPNLTLAIVKANPDFDWCWLFLSQNQMENDKPDVIRKELQQWFSRSNLKEELMATVWHPRNIHKFRYLDPDTFGEHQPEEGEDDFDF